MRIPGSDTLEPMNRIARKDKYTGTRYLFIYVGNYGILLEVELWELEGHGELSVELVDNVQELEEDGGEAAVLAGAVEAAAMVEPVPKGQPFLLDEDTESLEEKSLFQNKGSWEGQNVQNSVFFL